LSDLDYDRRRYLRMHRDKIKPIKEEARRISQSYHDSCEYKSDIDNYIGRRKVRRNPLSPYIRPDNLLKTDIYRLSCDINYKGLDKLVECAVLIRDKGFVHRPRNPNAIDWTLRLVNGPWPREHEKKGGIQIFDKTKLTRFTIELKFAFKHNICPDFVVMFVDYMGGYEIISARELDDGHDFSDNEWIKRIQRSYKLSDQNVPLCEDDEDDFL